jgi:hypothetical protein
MLLINGSTIMLTRGDTATIIVGLTTEDGSAYSMQEGDVLKLAAKKSVRCADAVIEKESTDGVFEFAPEDTEGLAFGDYKYDIQLTTAGGDVYTVVPVSTFRVMEEIA